MEARYPSKERVERDGYLVYAEGDDISGDEAELARQGYTAGRKEAKPGDETKEAKPGDETKRRRRA